MTATEIARELAKKYNLNWNTQKILKKLIKTFISHGINISTTHKLMDEIIELFNIK